MNSLTINKYLLMHEINIKSKQSAENITIMTRVDDDRNEIHADENRFSSSRKFTIFNLK